MKSLVKEMKKKKTSMGSVVNSTEGRGKKNHWTQSYAKGNYPNWSDTKEKH